MNKGNIERSSKINKVLSEMKKAARKQVAKREVLHFRIDQANIFEIYEMAASKKTPVGTMIREWIIERLQQEKDMSQSKLSLQTINKRLIALEKSLTKH